MQYKVIIESCKDPARAQEIALEVARYSGFQATTIYDALLEKLICIKSKTSERDALSLKERFEKAGATVHLESIGANPSQTGNDCDDDEDEEPGRILSNEEYVEQLKKREDIFYIEKNTRLKRIEAVCLTIAICVGVWLGAQQVSPMVHSDFYEKDPFAKTIQATPLRVIDNTNVVEEEIIKNTEKVSLKPAKSQGEGGKNGGGGDPRARISRKGLLGIMSGNIKGKTVASSDIFAKGGFAKNIDAILQGVGGLKSGGEGGAGRKTLAGIGFGSGLGSGTGGGPGIDNLLKDLLKSDASSIRLKKRDPKIFSPLEKIALITEGGSLKDGRNKKSIMRVVMQNLSALRYAYNKRLGEKPGLKGRITCKFAIDEYGKVLFCKVESSSMNDQILEKEIVNKIRRWVFEKIDKPGDVTEVVYPFVFTS